MAQHPWTEETTDQLKELVALRPPLSGSQIADRINTTTHQHLTRCAIIGKAHRLGLKLDGSSANRINGQAMSANKKRKPNGGNNTARLESKLAFREREAQFSAAIEAREPEPRGIKLIDLDMVNDCRWPIGNPASANFFYCGNPRKDPGGRSVYCAFHHRKSYAPAKPPQRNHVYLAGRQRY